MGKMFDIALEKHLSSLDSEFNSYQQYFITEKKGFFYVFNEQKNKILGSRKTINEAKEFIDTICSGC